MARGFDSKFVEAQQEEAARGRAAARPPLTPAEREVAERRGALQLSRTRAQADLRKAQAPAHRAMLERAIAALDAELEALPGGA